jgi:16S rRNA (adenine1518-N6/adenine1519-N6)-dimethyltransferase
MGPERLLRPRKSLGQNFLRDENIARKIVASIEPQTSDILIEIGPGEGALTGFLAGRVRELILVELDSRAIRILRERFDDRRLSIVHGDFLEYDLQSVVRRTGDRVRIVGNIPYNITSPILFHILDNRAAVRDATLMMQKEVARRLVARPGSKEYGIPSVFCECFAHVERLFDVSPNVFFPRPAVLSTVVRITPMAASRYPLEDEGFFREMVRSVFGKRRKTLKNSLLYFLGDISGPLPHVIDYRRRPESLSVAELADLSNHLLAWRAGASEA